MLIKVACTKSKLVVVKFTTGKIYRLKFTITTIINQYNKRENEKQKRENKRKDYEVTI